MTFALPNHRSSSWEETLLIIDRMSIDDPQAELGLHVTTTKPTKPQPRSISPLRPASPEPDRKKNPKYPVLTPQRPPTKQSPRDKVVVEEQEKEGKEEKRERKREKKELIRSLAEAEAAARKRVQQLET
jgi:hypothetical protein